MKITKITKEQIPPLAYEGFLWKSNAATPEVFDNKKIEATDLPDLPFVVEGLLYAQNENISIRITNIDGTYVISKMDIESYDAQEVQSYILDKKRFNEKEKINLYQHHEEQTDPDNDGWMVLKATWFAFVGF